VSTGAVRRPFAHRATVKLSDGADPAAVGAAITTALCGHWEHDPPCPLAPHHTVTVESGSDLRVRTVFVADPGRERDVRRLIRRALATGHLEHAQTVSRWTVKSSGPSTVRREELAVAERLVS
jgi:hypothetical protein